MFLALSKTFWHILRLIFTGSGLQQSADSQWYLDYAFSLINNFKIGLEMNDIMYFGYNILLSLLLAVFKDPLAVIFTQAAATGISVILVYKISMMLFNRTTAVIASFFYCMAWDFTLWSMYILSDSFFVSLSLLCVYFLLKAFESGKKNHKVLFAATSLYMLVFRPTGIVVMAAFLVYILIMAGRKKTADFLKKQKIAVGTFLAFVALACAYLYAGHKFDPLISSVQYNAKLVLYNVYAKGWIYDKATGYDHFFRPDYKINICGSLVLSFILNNWEHVLVIYAKRAVAFLGVWVWSTDIKSISGLLTLVYNLFPAALFLAGTIAAVRNKLFKKASVVWFIILAVFAFCVLIFIDAMYRYRFPAVPFIIIVAAYGTERMVHGAKKVCGDVMAYGRRQNTNHNSGF